MIHEHSDVDKFELRNTLRLLFCWELDKAMWDDLALQKEVADILYGPGAEYPLSKNYLKLRKINHERFGGSEPPKEFYV